VVRGIRQHYENRQSCEHSIASLILTLTATLFAILATATPAQCQESHADHAERKNEFAFWGSYSVNSPDLYGSRAHGDFGAVAFRYGRIVSSTRHRVIEYTLDILPAEVLHELTYAPCTVVSNGQLVSSHCATGHQIVYGGGFAPLGWKFNFSPNRRLQPFAALSGGIMGSVARIPTDIPGGALFNFTAEWQLGFQRFNASHTRAWIFGYKLEHISDGFRTSVNPGIDLNVLFVGYSFFK
jgi:Lipid A 3-O-deacylase (PagL)